MYNNFLWHLKKRLKIFHYSLIIPASKNFCCEKRLLFLNFNCNNMYKCEVKIKCNIIIYKR